MPDPGAGVALGAVIGLSAASAWGVNNVLIALVSRRLDSARTLGVWQIWTLLATAAVAVIGAFGLPADPGLLVAAVIAGFFGGLGYVFLFAALRLGPLTIVSPIIAASGGLTVVFATVLLGESLHSGQAVGVVLATIGVLIVGVRFDRDLRQTRLVGAGVAAALGALVGFALMNVASGPASHELGWLASFVSVRTVASAVILVAIGIPAVRSVLGYHGGPRLGSLPSRFQMAIVVGSVFSVLGFVLLMVGMEGAPAWVVGLTSSLAPVFVSFAGLIAFGERLTKLQVVGSVLVVASLPLIVT